MKAKKTWILVADGARARILQSKGPGSGLKSAFKYEFAAPHSATRDFVSDKPGRSQNSASGAGHGFEPPVDWHQFEKTRFAHDVATILNKAVEKNSYDSLVLVAPPQALGALRRQLNKKALNRVAAELGKDFTHVPVHDLETRLSEVMVV